jgi:hypothetical protein
MPDPICTNARPGLAFYPNLIIGAQLWLSWKSEDSDDSIYYVIYNGTWSPQMKLVLLNSLAVKTTDGPTLVSINGDMYIMWKGSLDNGIY